MAGIKRRTEFFEVNITPKSKKSRDSDPPTLLNLAPFALIPKVCFSNIPVNETMLYKVHIRNPSDLVTDILLELNDEINEVGLEFNATTFSLPPNGTDILEISWKPTSAIQWRGKIPVKHVNGDKKFSYMSVACSSVSPPPKKGMKKKAITKNKPCTPKRSENTNGKTVPQTYALPPCKSKTPIRRETYEVAKPTFFGQCITPSIKAEPFFSMSELIVEEEQETHFYTSRLVSSSPQAKDNIRQLREPLKEYNYNTQIDISFKKEEISIERKTTEVKYNDSFEITNTTYERDSLDSPVRWSRSDSPVFSTSPFYLTKESSVSVKKQSDSILSQASSSGYVDVKPKLFTPSKAVSAPIKFSQSLPRGVTPKKDGSPTNKPFNYFSSRADASTPMTDKSFYLTRPDSPEVIQTKNRNVQYADNSFLSQVPDDFNSSMMSEILPIQDRNSFQFGSRTDGLHNYQSLPVSDLKESCVSLSNNLDAPKPRSVRFNTTFHVLSSPPSNKNATQRPLSQQSVSFNISPARPIFCKSVSEINSSRFQRIGRKGSKESVRPRTAGEECDNSVFSEINAKKSLYDEPDYLLHPYGVTTISNPFSRHAVHPSEWLEKLELELIKWLNSLLTPPIELGSIVEGVDVKKLWDQSTAADLKIAPSREAASKDYVLSDGSRMNVLRKAAATLARSDEIKKTFYNIRGKIDSGFLSVKDNISLYHNQGARVKLVQLCMYYNPLWLRIALEVIYEQVIPLQEKKIHCGLVYFLKNHFLSDQKILDKHKFTKSNHPQGSSFTTEMNNFIMLKFFSLIYFLDQAKKRKLIPYDPCLFCKNSPIKKSEEMLDEFVKDFLKCVGQFKKTLKFLGYKLEYNQTCLDEFDYGLTSHLELRDGVRLTRTMEIILKDPSYSSKLWTPALSRIQKIHNVQVALSALQNNGYQISKEISPSDIVNGHREKIFSLLWQILHEFLAPRYQSAATRIQCWWRKNYLKVFIRKRIAMKKYIIILQALVRGFLVRRNIKKRASKAVLIQKWFKRNRGCLNDRKEFLKKKSAVIKIQSWYRQILIVRKERQSFLLKRSSAIIIQRLYRKYSAMRLCRDNYLRLKTATVTIQRWFRAVLSCKKERKAFLELRSAAIVIQQRFRANMICKSYHQNFLSLCNATTKIQRWFRNKSACKPHISQFLKQKQAAIVIQRAFRLYKLKKRTRELIALRNKSAAIIQNCFRGYLETKRCRQEFVKKREGAITIQKWYRKILFHRQQKKILLIRTLAAVKIQKWYRESRKVLEERKKFIMMKREAIKIQRWYKHCKKLQKIREMQKLADAATTIQAIYRGYITRKKMEPIKAKMPKKCLRQKTSNEGLILSVIFNNALSFFNSQNKPKNRNLGDVATAYNELDICTLFSPVLCLQLSKCASFYEYLWCDLSQGLRTGPYLDIFRHGLNIIIKLIKFSETTDSVVQSMEMHDGPGVLIGLMLKFIEKNTDIYCKVVTIFWLLLTSPNERARQIKDQLDVERIVYLHKKIKTKKCPQAKKQYLPSKKVDWGYWNRSVEFLSIKTATEELVKILSP